MDKMEPQKKLKMECCVWCVDPDAAAKNEQAGVEVYDTKDHWTPYAFDLADVMILKQCGTNDFIEEGAATTLTFYGDIVATVNIPFPELYEKWKDL